MDDLLAQVSRDVSEGRYGAVVSTSADLLDPVMAQVMDARVEVIVGADDAQRAAALALVSVQADHPQRIGDVAADQNAARLRQQTAIAGASQTQRERIEVAAGAAEAGQQHQRRAIAK